MTSLYLDPTLLVLIGQFEREQWRTVKSKTYTQNKQPLDKTQSSKLCQLGVTQTRFQDLKEKRKWFFDHSTGGEWRG